MNRAEAALVVRKLAAYQPNQQLDAYAVDAWADALAHVDHRDALDAVATLALAPRIPGQPFLIELRDVYAEVGRIRRARLAERRHLLPDPPSGLSEVEYRAWLIEIEGAASGRDWTPAPALDLPSRPVAELVAPIGRASREDRS